MTSALPMAALSRLAAPPLLGRALITAGASAPALTAPPAVAVQHRNAPSGKTTPSAAHCVATRASRPPVPLASGCASSRARQTGFARKTCSMHLEAARDELPGCAGRLQEESLQAVMDDVERFASMKPYPVSVDEVLQTLEPNKIAKFIHTEVPIRFAERIKWIEEIPNWQQVPDLLRVHRSHLKAFVDLRKVQRLPNLDDFTKSVRSASGDQGNTVVSMARAMSHLRNTRGEEYGPEFADKFLDAFLLSRIGSNVLMSQYLACVKEADDGVSTTGIIDPRCNPTKVCSEAAHDVKIVCMAETGIEPEIKVEAFSTVGGDNGVPSLPYIPSLLRYIMCELLKNSCKATMDLCQHAGPDASKSMPINVIICADVNRVQIRVSDRARGIPFEVGPGVFSYLYSTSRRNGDCPSELSGYGVGLPLSRLYARYLGGSLDLVSMPGYGTDAYLVLPRLPSELLEVVPDIHQDYRYSSLATHLL